MNLIIEFLADEEGATMAEYATMLGLITVVLVSVITALGTRISTVISNATTSLPA